MQFHTGRSQSDKGGAGCWLASSAVHEGQGRVCKAGEKDDRDPQEQWTDSRWGDVSIRSARFPGRYAAAKKAPRR